METKGGKVLKAFYHVMYWLVFLGILAILIFRLLNKIPFFDINCVFLIIILCVLLLFPVIDKFAIKGIIEVQKASYKIDNASEAEGKESEAEEQNELDTQMEKHKLSVSEIRELVRKAFIETSKQSLTETDFEENMQIIQDYYKDTIGKYSPVFTWYTKKRSERFYEPKFTKISSAFYNKIYVMLSKIKLYNEANNSHLKLIVIFVNKTDSNIGVEKDEITNFCDLFKPAIDSKLLETKDIEIKIS